MHVSHLPNVWQFVHPCYFVNNHRIAKLHGQWACRGLTESVDGNIGKIVRLKTKQSESVCVFRVRIRHTGPERQGISFAIP